MENISKSEKNYLIGYAAALQDIMLKLRGDNTCGKSYDPMSIEGTFIHSYAFDLKSGGRHHHISDFSGLDEIKELMLNQAVDFCKPIKQ